MLRNEWYTHLKLPLPCQTCPTPIDELLHLPLFILGFFKTLGGFSRIEHQQQPPKCNRYHAFNTLPPNT
eukprot:4067721-Amphidinium_carterae.1